MWVKKYAYLVGISLIVGLLFFPTRWLRATPIGQTEGVKTAVILGFGFEKNENGGLCPECQFIIPQVPDTPYPKQSTQLRTRHEIIYRYVDLLARIRFSPLFTSTLPQTCPMPIIENP